VTWKIMYMFIDIILIQWLWVICKINKYLGRFEKKTYTLFNISRLTKKWFVKILFQYVLAIDYIYLSSPFHNIVFLASDIEHLSKESSKNYTVFISYFTILILAESASKHGDIKLRWIEQIIYLAICT
jgi:hypothetical protein